MIEINQGNWLTSRAFQLGFVALIMRTTIVDYES